MPAQNNRYGGVFVLSFGVGIYVLGLWWTRIESVPPVNGGFAGVRTHVPAACSDEQGLIGVGAGYYRSASAGSILTGGGISMPYASALR